MTRTPGIQAGLLALAAVAATASLSFADDALFTLESATVKGGDPVKITIPNALPEAEGKHWVCLVKKGAADSSFGIWSYLAAGAKSHTLKAPAVDGEYEVRLHSHYPAKSNNVRHRVALTVTGLTPTKAEDQKLVLSATSGPVDFGIKVTFKVPLVPEAERRFWVSLVPAGAPDTAQGLWRFVPTAAGELTLSAPTASGKHEIRLHSNYPKQSTNVVHRLAFEVTGAADTVPTDPAQLSVTLGAASIACSAKPTINFSIPVRPLTGQRFSVSLVNAELPAQSLGLTSSVKPGAKSVALSSPTSTGKHRVDVYCSYSQSPRQLVASLPLEVTGSAAEAPTQMDAVTLTLASATIKVGAKPKVSFGTKLLARTGERFWVTVIEVGKKDTEWGKYTYAPIGVSELELVAPTAAGKYEVRLHSQHPTKSSNVEKRLALTVE